ncbi:MAG: DivIVA domain-containing protein [Ferrimicrobium sp.]|nr:DivIVA domain-containing protein [Ferrimicrobium sp.]
MEGNAVDAQRIREVEFRERMRGYHQEDVDEFLEQVAKGVEVLETQLAQAQEELARLKANPPAPVTPGVAKVGDDVIQRTLIVAQQAADQLRGDAEKEAREIRAEAQRQAERILAEARSTSKLIEEERRKNLLEELGQLEGEFTRRQEQLANIVARDRAVRQKITDEIGSLLSLVRVGDGSMLEGEGTARSQGVPGLNGDNDIAVSAEPGWLTSALAQESADVADLSSGSVPSKEPRGTVCPEQPTSSESLVVPQTPRVETVTGDRVGDGEDHTPAHAGDQGREARPIQEFVFGHDISSETVDEDEPFMLWRQDD